MSDTGSSGGEGISVGSAFVRIRADLSGFLSELTAGVSAASAGIEQELGNAFTKVGNVAKDTTAAANDAGVAMSSVKTATKDAEAGAADAEKSVRSLGNSFGTISAGATGLRANFHESFGKIGEDVKANSTLLSGVFVAAIGIAAVASVDLAAKFQASMELIHTQAGVPQQDLAKLKTGVLDLAGSVGTSPGNLSDALYHIESSFASTGISGQKAMMLLKTAAEGARVGQANLVDVTNALDGAVVAGIPGAENLDKAMGALNATVGAGDMHMQDLADAFGHGTVVLAKNFGLSLTDVGAALATFGDNNIRGAAAGTQLRMMLQSLAAPTQKGAAMLDKLGLSGAKLADDMAHGGLNQAITDLKDHLEAAGVTGVKTADYLTQAFGKKAGAGTEILISQYDRLQSKYADIDKGASGFADAWAQTEKTVSQKWADMRSAVEALAIRIGTVLLPIVGKMADAFAAAANYLVQHKEVMIALAAVIGVVLVAAIYTVTAAIGAFIVSAVVAAAPMLAIAAAVGLLAAGFIYAYDHIKGFRDAVNDLGNTLSGALKTGLKDAKGAWDAFIAGFTNPTAAVSGNVIFSGFIKAGQDFEHALADVQYAWKAFIAGFKDGTKIRWAAGDSIFTDVAAFGQKVRQVFDTVKELFGGVADLFNGNSKGAAKDIGTALGLDPKTAEGFVKTLESIKGTVSDVVEFVSSHWKVLAAIFVTVTAPVIAIAAAVIYAYEHFKTFHAIVNELALVFEQHIVPVLKIVAEYLVNTLGNSIKFVQGVIELIIDLLDGKWGKAWDDLVQIVRAVWDQIGNMLSTGAKLVGQLLDELWSLIKSGASAVWGWLWKEIKEAWDKVSGVVGDGIKAVLAFFSALPGQIESAVSSLTNLLYTHGRDLLTGLWNGAKDVFKAVVKWVKDLPKNIAFGLGYLSGVLYKQGGDLLTGLWNGIKSVDLEIWKWFTDLPKTISNLISDIATWLNGPGGDMIHGFLVGVHGKETEVWNWFKDLPKAIEKLISDIGTWLLKNGSDLIHGLWNGIKAVDLEIWKWFTDLPNNIWNLITNIATWLINNGSDLIHGLVNGIRNVEADVWNWFKNLPHTIAGLLSDALHWLETTGSDVLHGLLNGAKAAANDVWGWLKSLGGMVEGYLSDAGSWLYSAGQNIIHGLFNGIKATIGDIGSFFGGLGKEAVKGFNAGTHSSSPSKDFHQAGINIMSGLANGINDNVHQVDSAMNNALNAVKSPKFAASLGKFTPGSPGAVATGGGSTPGATVKHFNLNVTPQNAKTVDVVQQFRQMERLSNLSA